MRTLVLCVALLLVLALIATACGRPAAPTPAPAPTPEAAPAPPPAPTPAPTPKVRRLRLADSNPASSAYPLFVAFASSINERVPGLQVTVLEAKGSVASTKEFVEKRAEIALASKDPLIGAYTGSRGFEGRARPDIRVMMPVAIIPHIWFVREDSGVKGFADLNGKNFHVPTGSYSEGWTKKFFGALGIEVNYVGGDMATGIELVKNKQAVGTAKNAAGPTRPDAVFLQLQAFTPMRVLSFTEAEVATLKKAFPDETFTTIPAGVYGDEPIVTWLGGGWNITGKDILSPEEVEKILDAWQADWAKFREIYPGVPADPVEGIFQFQPAGGVPLHSGTVRWLVKKGKTVPPHLVPPEHTGPTSP